MRMLHLLVIAALLSLAACSTEPTPPAATERTVPMSNPASNDAATQITVYSGDFDAVSAHDLGAQAPGLALVKQRIARELGAGANVLIVTGLPRALDAGGVDLNPLGEGVRLRGQRYEFALADPSQLLQRAIGQTVEVGFTSGNARQIERGVLLAAGDGLTLQLHDGRVRLIRQYDSFDLPNLPAGLNAEPTLRWEVEADKGGRQEFELDTPTGGLAWRAEYRIDFVRNDGCRMDFAGNAMIANRSGAGFDGARLTLVAGEPNRAQRVQPAPRMKMRAEVAVADYGGAPERRQAGEYHAYTLSGTADLPDGSVQRVPLLEPVRGAACERVYQTRAEPGDRVPPRPMVDPNYGATGRQPVQAILHFTNDRAGGLGLPLPAGRVRMFEGADFLGEAMLEHTPAGAEIKLVIGTAFDLIAERKREDFRLDPTGRTLTERFSITLKNAKPDAVSVRVVERLPRWTDWEIVDAGAKWKKEDAQSVLFELPVPALGEATLSYAVRYRWADNVKPQ